jgi:hypothetical protein
MLNFSTLSEFETQLLKSPCVLSAKERSKVLSRVLSVSPTQESEFPITKFDWTHLCVPRKLKDKLILALLSWYMVEEIGDLVRLDLEENWGADSEEVGAIVLTSKEYCLSWFIIQKEFDSFEFFGNYLSEARVSTILKQLQFHRLSAKKVKRYTGYCRGHRESNSTGPKPLPAELVPGTLSLEEIEQRKVEFQQRLLSLLYEVEVFVLKQSA